MLRRPVIFDADKRGYKKKMPGDTKDFRKTGLFFAEPEFLIFPSHHLIVDGFSRDCHRENHFVDVNAGVNDTGLMAFKGFFEFFVEFCVILSLVVAYSVSGGQFFPIRAKIKRGVAVAFFVKKLLPDADITQSAVVYQNDYDWKAVAGNGAEFVAVHAERAVTCDMNDAGRRMTDLNSHCGPGAEAHCSQSARSNETARLSKGVELSRPHLMLADLCRDVGIISGVFVYGFKHEFWID